MRKVKIFICTLIALVFFVQTPVEACNKTQSETYIEQLIFGNDAGKYNNNTNKKLLLDAVYLCCEQCDGHGQNEINLLHKYDIKTISTIQEIDLKEKQLYKYLHNSWDAENDTNQIKKIRKTVLQDTVNKVFDFGFFSNIFNSRGGKCDYFSALLYYFHILADHIADNPEDASIEINKVNRSYMGNAYCVINNDEPRSGLKKEENKSKVELSELDELGRAGVAYAVIGLDTMPEPNSRQQIGFIKPSGWNQNKYPDVINSSPAYLFNRCHLIAHELIGNDKKQNLITGTGYMNNIGMKPLEDDIARYIEETGNHVAYRVEPIYKGNNLIATGVRIEAYSIEDEGTGKKFNRFYYNVQPGICIDYSNGKNELGDKSIEVKEFIPFAVRNADDNNRDLIYEINKYLEKLFESQKESNNYQKLMNSLDKLADNARKYTNNGKVSSGDYVNLNKCMYEYMQTLQQYVPLLLKNEDFFKKTFP